jgi:hypothetical protein
LPLAQSVAKFADGGERQRAFVDGDFLFPHAKPQI